MLKVLYNEYGGAVRSVLQHANANRIQTAYDGLGRLSTRKVYVNGSAYTTAYAYAPGAESGQTTALVQEITQPGENHSYAYDNVGNIVSAARNGVTTTYAYDALGQLIRVNDPNDGTWTYEYDCGGNILSKKKYAYTTGTLGTVQQIVSYAYGDADWKDKLTRYNGVDIAYDAIGNPIHDGVWAYTWENGRQLRRMACDATIAEFVYNADGLRVQKTVNGVTTNYTLHGKNIVHMTKGNAELHFWYDAQNRPAIVEFNGTKYGYLYNLQGDVIGLIDSANTEVVKYTYDAWGKPLSVTGPLANTIGYYNPFRYRGYVYDVETGLYYLRSRYYCSQLGRFLNADTFVKGNIFSYCNNTPISMEDQSGHECSLCNKEHYAFTGKFGDTMIHVLQKGKNPRMPVCQFLAFIKQMSDEQWSYAPRSEEGIWYGHVDCVGVYRFTMNWYFHDDPYKELKMHFTNVEGLYRNGVYNKNHGAAIIGKGAITENTQYTIGMALFRIIKNGTNGTQSFEHVAFYVGDYFDGYTNAVIEAVEGGVVIRSLEESEKNGAFTHYGYLKGVDYDY